MRVWRWKCSAHGDQNMDFRAALRARKAPSAGLGWTQALRGMGRAVLAGGGHHPIGFIGDILVGTKGFLSDCKQPSSSKIQVNKRAQKE